MIELTEIDKLVLNETLDDAENLEQIHRSLSLLPARNSGDQNRATGWYGSEPQMSLAEIADTIQSLVERQLLIVRHDPAEPSSNNDDLSYVWRCWFEPSSEARELCSAPAQAEHEGP